VWIGRQARCRYVEAAAHLLITIRAQLIERILGSRYVQVDETFTKLIEPDRGCRSRGAIKPRTRRPSCSSAMAARLHSRLSLASKAWITERVGALKLRRQRPLPKRSSLEAPRAHRGPAAPRSWTIRGPARLRLRIHLKSEGVLAWIKISREDYKAIHGEGEGYLLGQTPALPALEMAAEDYRRLVRLAADGTEPTLTMSTAVRYEDGNSNAYNVIADIPGSDPHAGYVMVGAHLDSWHAADGAMDDGAGVTITMEAARILLKLGLHPKRAIRFALFAGEEEELVGSRAYVAQHIASRPIDARTDINGA
jgi:hypothetical protein